MARCFLIILFGCLATVATAAQPASPEMNDAERRFAELLTGAKLVGAFSMDAAPSAPPNPEGYEIVSAVKLQGEQWVVQAKMTYKGIDLPIPIPVQVHWAGDTPVLQVTNLTIPLLGEGFFARVLFYDGRYAGTWQHGKKGGHLWGKIERAVKVDESPEKIQPTSPSK